jgi:microcin C transport system permease protein
MDFSREGIPTTPHRFFTTLPPERQKEIADLAVQSFTQQVTDVQMELAGHPFNLSARPHSVEWPYPPVRGHWLGIDSSGRDVLVRILYGLRTSMTFGLLLVFGALFAGTVIGAIQGYFAGITDISMQRLIEIWSALPFLYIMILIGSIYGRSFVILLFCYGLFNWIGISYYIRAEFLRLRRFAFVDAARCMGIPSRRIMFRHILPNALTPLITFFPFSLVGAISALAALDYLGFGLPPPTPSWGELFHQAQTFRWAWWLILYPALALFTVMLLGVFIGEGVRDAFDPKPYSRIE